MGVDAWFDDHAHSLNGYPDGFEGPATVTLIDQALAKNAIVVGAVEDVPGGVHPFTEEIEPGGSSNDQLLPMVRIAEFSSLGPARDGRVKPDLVANGVSVRLTTPSYGDLIGP